MLNVYYSPPSINILASNQGLIFNYKKNVFNFFRKFKKLSFKKN